MKKDIDFFSAYRSSGQPGMLGTVDLMGIVVIAVSLAVTVGAIIAVNALDFGVSLETNNINSYLSAQTVVSAEAAVSTNTMLVKAYQGYGGAVSAAQSRYDSLVHPSSSIIKAIEKCIPSDVKTTEVTYQDGVFTLTCTSTKEISGAAFAHALKNSGRFSEVTYAGTIKTKNFSFTLSFAINRKGVS